MKLSVTKKFVLALTSLVLLSTGATFFSASFNYSSTLEQTLQNNINVAQNNFASITKAKQSEYIYLAKIGARFEGLSNAIINKDAQALKDIANSIMRDGETPLVTLTDEKGNVLSRSHSDIKGDNISSQNIIANALQGTSSSGITMGSIVPYSMRGASPIRHNGKIVGTIILGDSLSNPEYLDWLGGLLKAQVTFFIDDTRVMTTIKSSSGQRIVGTKLNNQHIENQVLNQGKAYFGESQINGENYLAAYWPATNHSNKTVGMWFIGLPVSLALQAESDAFFYSALESFIGLIVALGISLFIAFKFTAPIKKIARFAIGVTKGEENLYLDINTNDEFEEVAVSLKNMVDKLKEQTHWYQSVLDALPINISVTDMDRNWILVNKAGLSGTGKKLEDLIGQPCHTRNGNLCNTPDCGITRLEQGYPEAINRLPNGKVMQMRLSYLHNSNGDKIGHVEVGLDITEQDRLKQEAALSAESAKQQLVNQIESIVVILDNATNQLTSAIDMAEDDAKNTASRMINVNSAMREMEITIQDVALNASKAASDAADTQSHAQHGHDVVQYIVDDIMQVQTTADELKDSMEKLSEHAHNIGTILGMIRDIADQTNLLALNAAIEAARAGESGRGFAVVADEVRKLAEKSMLATKDVDTAIQIIQNHTTESTKTMGATVEAVHKVTNQAQNAGNNLSDIVDLSVSTAHGVSIIATAAEEQAATSKDISQTVADSNQLAQNLASSMGQASFIVKNVSEQATLLRGLIDDIKNETHG